ncbi:MAG: tRNA (adenosine(37)-N6)-threonylcarbamoyltransferase complex ATPase subunit type 1 TsaE [Coriobacteriales bacterium]|jgi:tRNA threonylcarbamoyladenosine biosynthesis protein TsaE|nr:tRNA (adenosine(37)-N6)-threonylcarbamoyltransferase complex ATPase subunit type 1 TsaE [Coriobacteriales bacterium]
MTTHGEAETLALGERLGALLKGGDVVLLDGCLGAGKTRLAKGIARGLGLTGELTSPSFNLVLEYPLAGGATDEQLPTPQHRVAQRLTSPRSETACPESTPPVPPPPTCLRHFDLYRLDSAEQLADFDYFGLIEEEGAVSLVEWGSRFASGLPLAYLAIRLELHAACPEQRLLTFEACGVRAEALLACLAASETAGQHD